jgi:molybdopterin converting factor subunit 1
MKVAVKLFAMVREIVGFDEITVTLERPNPTVSDLRAEMTERYPGLLPWMPFSQVAVNQEVAADEQPLQPTDEIAILPPFSGG